MNALALLERPSSRISGAPAQLVSHNHLPSPPSPATTIRDQPAAEVIAAINRIASLTTLREGWDGHTGKPVTLGIATYSLQILLAIMKPSLPSPSIVPLASGGLQFEWHRNGWDVEIEILSPNHVQAWAHNLQTGQISETTMTTDVSALYYFMQPLLQR